ncbi:Membrane-associated phospholipid phosphatase [Spirosoma endophyticum]|uniref:Membrane-associated phospholipid phosphatase n=2 Tax=Spirosoma endophyticum TaxID=662367 RepID=A0A1I1PY13_9BACT|nr:Membrane-associated phospholipid phosphatase [Spirosoma endophyticum]
MLELLQKNRFFYFPYILVMVVVAVIQINYTQGELMLWVNSRNSLVADLIFPYVTYLGDGAFYVVVSLILMIYNWRVGLMGLASFALSSLTSEFLKKLVFTDSPRPLKFFEQSINKYHLIEGLDIHSFNSFPSGHTTTAFAMFSLLALLDVQKERGWIFLLLAILTGYSRVYLFQHFVEDAYVGSLIGTISTVVVYVLLRKWTIKSGVD